MTWDLNIIGLTSSTINSSEKYIDLLIEFLSSFWPKLIWALIILWIGFKIVNLLNRWMEKFMEKADWDPMLESFIVSLSSIIFKTLLLKD